jgi:hypothetical protein
MSIFGYNAIGVNQLGLTDTDLFGNFNNARIALRGNPVIGGNLISAHVYMVGPPAGVNVTVQIGVYDATGGVPPAFPLFATSTAFNLPVGAPGQWWVTPIAGVLVAGNSYVAAVLGNNAHVSNGSVMNDPIANEYVIRDFIAPGVFPNPLGVGNNATREWSLFITYETDAYTPTSACACSDS